MDPVDVVESTGGVVGDVVEAVAAGDAAIEAEEIGDALNLTIDVEIEGMSEMEEEEVTYDEPVCDDCTYPSSEVEHFCQLGCSSTDLKVHRKFRPLVLR